LLQNTPNPTNNVTTIYFQLNEQNEGYINIISSIGETVREIHFSKAAGLHNIELDMSRLPVGLYYYSMVINGKRIDTKKNGCCKVVVFLIIHYFANDKNFC